MLKHISSILTIFAQNTGAQPLFGEFYKTFSLSTFFANSSFFFLFLAMTFSWIDLAFFDKNSVSAPIAKVVALLDKSEPDSSFVYKAKTKQPAEIIKASGFYSPNNIINAAINAGGFYKAHLNSPFLTKDVSHSTLNRIFYGHNPKIFLSILVANLTLICLLCIRWKESGHFPLRNLYESLMFLSWSCTSIHLFLIINNHYMGFNNITNQNSKFIENLLGAVLAPSAFFLNAFATFSLPKEMQEAGPLVPALQSNWLMMHVTVMILSYAALILGSLLSIVFLISKNIQKFFVSKKKKPCAPENGVNAQALNELQQTQSPWFKVTTQESPFFNLGQKNLYSNLDYLSYRIIGVGFPFLTIGILSGAVWANEAWGSYWSWDPKETWALLTWLIFAIYLHTRLTTGLQGEKPAIIASCGFIVVWVCYLGVNLLGEGLHSYGFFNSGL